MLNKGGYYSCFTSNVCDVPTELLYMYIICMYMYIYVYVYVYLGIRPSARCQPEGPGVR